MGVRLFPSTRCRVVGGTFPFYMRPALAVHSLSTLSTPLQLTFRMRHHTGFSHTACITVHRLDGSADRRAHIGRLHDCGTASLWVVQ